MTKMNDDGGLIGMRTEDLRVQALKNPLGINENPVFSWQLVSDKKDEKNEKINMSFNSFCKFIFYASSC